MATRDGRDPDSGNPADRPASPGRRWRHAELVPILVGPGILTALVVAAPYLRRADRPTGMAEADVRWVSLAPGGEFVAGVPLSGPQRIEVWAADTGTAYATVPLRPPPPGLNAYAVAPDGRQAAVVLGRNLVLHALPSAQVERTVRLTPWQGGDDRPPWLVYAGDGSEVVMAYEGALVRVDRQTGAERVVLTGLQGGNVRYARDADLVAELHPATPGKAGEARLIDLRSGSPRPAFPVPELTHQYDRVFDVSADGSAVAVGATTGGKGPAAVHVFDGRTGRRTASFPMAPAGPDRVVFESVRLSPDGSRVAASGKVLDAAWTVVRILGDVRAGTGRPFGPAGESGKRDPVFLPEITAFAPDGLSFAYLTRGGIRIYDVAAGADR